MKTIEIRPAPPPTREDVKNGLHLDADNRMTDKDPELWKCRKCGVQWAPVSLEKYGSRYGRKADFEHKCGLCNTMHRIVVDGIFVEVTPL